MTQGTLQRHRQMPQNPDLGRAEAQKGNPEPQNWVAVKELKLSYYIGETLLFTIYTHYGNLIYVP